MRYVALVFGILFGLLALWALVILIRDITPGGGIGLALHAIMIVLIAILSIICLRWYRCRGYGKAMTSR
jgi:uncharacterized membrane protein (UPF0136 family)